MGYNEFEQAYNDALIKEAAAKNKAAGIAEMKRLAQLIKQKAAQGGTSANSAAVTALMKRTPNPSLKPGQARKLLSMGVNPRALGVPDASGQFISGGKKYFIDLGGGPGRRFGDHAPRRPILWERGVSMFDSPIDSLLKDTRAGGAGFGIPAPEGAAGAPLPPIDVTSTVNNSVAKGLPNWLKVLAAGLGVTAGAGAAGAGAYTVTRGSKKTEDKA